MRWIAALLIVPLLVGTAAADLPRRAENPFAGDPPHGMVLIDPAFLDVAVPPWLAPALAAGSALRLAHADDPAVLAFLDHHAVALEVTVAEIRALDGPERLPWRGRLGELEYLARLVGELLALTEQLSDPAADPAPRRARIAEIAGLRLLDPGPVARGIVSPADLFGLRD